MSAYRQYMIEHLHGSMPVSDIDEICDLAEHASNEAIAAIDRITKNASTPHNGIAALVAAIDMTTERGKYALSNLMSIVKGEAA